ncbi:hypothetical protein [Halopiger xanaduensis]|uniref:Uncharacterized protein n=1 Tax=Halopiger xanaduensis (strain DSM 18323 / JCM 14033 / SH-6) TaxID=797210 RepID=F8DES1_HALXS|nr:hypothetical protein [Halopiger xanaduensis]AEH39511.1 hypothetical protein Halxa_0271 [Halopiger xanaduensis SH-6]
MSFGKPSNLSAEEYSEKIETLVALKAKLASLQCVESMDVNHDENGRIRGRVSLRHSESFLEFNDVLGDFPIEVVGIYSEDRAETGADGGLREAVEVRVLILEQ